MASAAITTPTALSAERAKPFFTQALSDTFRQTGARLGAVWILILVFLSVFAPFLASSFPLYAVLTDASTGKTTTQFPLLRQLSWIDITLLVAFFTTAVLLFTRTRLLTRFVTVVVVAVATGAVTFFTVVPPDISSYSTFRRAQTAGQVKSALLAPIPYSPSDRQPDAINADFQPPNRAHIFGTDRDSSDVASRLIHATRIALSIGFVATGIQIIAGVIVGGIMGYFAGKTDMLGMRLIEIFEAMPRLLVLISVTTFLGRNIFLMMVVIGLTGWPGTARYIRAEFLRLRNQDFVHAAVALGLPLRSILLRHMLPNGISPVLVSLSFGVASAILLESTLSFLGLGLVDSPSWGNMLDQARASGGGFNWWMAVFPTFMIFMTVFAYNLIGEALRDALDPKLRQ